MITFNDLIDKFDDQLNPIIVKELRQVVRGKFFWGVLILFLGFQCAVLSLSIAERGLTNRSVGADTLNFLFGILFFASFVLIPVYSAFRFTKERNEGTDELLFITTITPGAIIRGKFAASMVFILLIFSAFSPFMAMTFFLSGVDLSITFMALIVGLILSACGAMAQICFATLAREGNSQQFFRGIGIFVQIMMFFSITGVSTDLVRYGPGRILGGAEQTTTFLTFLICTCAGVYFLYLSASAIISPAGSNRMLSVRKCASWLWVLSLILTIFWAYSTYARHFIYMWGFFVCLGLCFSVLVAISERDYLSERVAREIPQGVIQKRLAFLFYSGAAGGLAWSISMLVLTLVAVNLFADLPIIPKSTGDVTEFSELALAFMGYCVGYGLIAAFLRRVFFASYVDVRNTWVIALLVCVAFSILPLFLGIFFESSSELLMLGNPFALTSRGNRFEAMLFGMLLGGGAIMISMPWLLRQAREFIGAGSKA